MSRRVFLLGLGLALVALALAFTDWVLSLQPGVTEANAKRIREGMTIEEVQAILGGLPRDRELQLGGWHVWTGEEGEVLVGFDRATHKVRWVSRFNIPYWRQVNRGPFTRLRSWLGW